MQVQRKRSTTVQVLPLISAALPACLSSRSPLLRFFPPPSAGSRPRAAAPRRSCYASQRLQPDPLHHRHSTRCWAPAAIDSEREYSRRPHQRTCRRVGQPHLVIAAGHYLLSAQLAVNRSVVIEAAVRGAVVLDVQASSSEQRRVLCIAPAPADVVELVGLNITGGYSADGGSSCGGHYGGGGVFITNGHVAIDECAVSRNVAGNGYVRPPALLAARPPSPLGGDPGVCGASLTGRRRPLNQSWQPCDDQQQGHGQPSRQRESPPPHAPAAPARPDWLDYR